MKLSDILKPPPPPQELRTPTIEYIEVPVPSIAPPQPPRPIYPARKPKPDMCSPAKQLEEWALKNVIDYVRKQIAGKTQPQALHYINEGHRNLLDKFLMFYRIFGLDHEGMKYMEHICITEVLDDVQWQLARIEGAVPPWSIIDSDWLEEQSKQKRREAKQRKLEAERQRREAEHREREQQRERERQEKEVRETVDEFRDRLFDH